MKMYDVTVPISEDLPIWPGNPGVSVKQWRSMARGDRSNVTQLELGVHTGTHIDAPNHFESDGVGIDELPLDVLMGPCRVFEMTDLKECLDRSSAEELDLSGVTRVLLKTRNSKWWKSSEKQFHSDFVYLQDDAARYFVERGVKLIGIDYLSIEKFKSPDHATHHTLLRNHIVIIEGLNLSGVPGGDYELIALPIKLKGADGAPTRVILRKQR